MRIILLSCFLLIGALLVHAQQSASYAYESDLLSKEFHRDRRDAVRNEMPDSSMAIFFANPERNRSNDVDYPYHQDPSFYYLTGFTEPNAVLILFKYPQNIGSKSTTEVLFVQDPDPEKETWTGRIAGPETATSMLGVSAVYSASLFDSLKIPYSSFREVLYLLLPKGLVDDRKEQADLFDLVDAFKKRSGYPANNGDDFKLGKMLAGLRSVKTKEELVLIRKAVDISVNAHREMMKALTPGMTEYQVQAVGEYFFKAAGSESPGYPSICGSGENSCILHYESNRKTTKSGELIVLDMGAEYHGYSADITRTLPVSGKFTDSQKSLYELVYRAQQAAFAECKPGNKFMDPHTAAKEVIKKGLLELGIIRNEGEVKKYFMHGTSHYLGLDVHDAGKYGPLVAGTIITVEPGIYIPEGSPCDPKWWNNGIRIEDDVLIKDDGMEVLSAGVPGRWEDIEKLMSEPSFLKK